MKRRDLEQHLKNHGCTLLRHGASHDVWISGTSIQTEVIPRHREIKTHLARKICRTLAVPQPPGS